MQMHERFVYLQASARAVLKLHMASLWKQVFTQFSGSPFIFISFCN